MNYRLAALAAALMTVGMLVGAPPAAAQIPTDGIWISRSALMALPTSGTAWNRLAQEAATSCPTPDLSNQDDPTNVCVMAKALVAARTGHAGRRSEVLAALTQIADGATYNGRALALGRELAAYVIAADLIELRAVDPALDQRFRSRIRVLLTTPTSGGPSNLVKCHEERPNNWGTHCGGSRIAVAAYLGDQTELARAARVFKGWLGDRASYAGFKYGDTSWQCDPSRPVGINPVGCLKLGNNIDGVIPDDQRRGGGFTWPPPKENYVYEALQGALAQAVILERAGYPAFDWESRALLRSFDWLHSVAQYPAVGEDVWEAHLMNHYYGRSFPAATPASPGKNIGWTDWTHPRGGYSPTVPQLPPPLPNPDEEPAPTPTPEPEPEPEPTKQPAPTPTPAPAPAPLPPPTDPGYIGQIKAISFEGGSLTDPGTGLDRVVGGAAITLETAAPLWGYYAARVTGKSVYLEESFSASSDFYLSFYMQLLSLPAGDVRIALISNGGESIGNLILRANGRLRLRAGSSAVGSESAPLVPGRIYRIGLHQRAGSGANAGLEAFLAEERRAFAGPFAVLSTGAWTTAANRIRVGATASAALDAVFDNAVLAAGEMPAP